MRSSRPASRSWHLRRKASGPLPATGARDGPRIGITPTPPNRSLRGDGPSSRAKGTLAEAPGSSTTPIAARAGPSRECAASPGRAHALPPRSPSRSASRRSPTEPMFCSRESSTTETPRAAKAEGSRYCLQREAQRHQGIAEGLRPLRPRLPQCSPGRADREDLLSGSLPGGRPGRRIQPPRSDRPRAVPALQPGWRFAPASASRWRQSGPTGHPAVGTPQSRRAQSKLSWAQPSRGDSEAKTGQCDAGLVSCRATLKPWPHRLAPAHSGPTSEPCFRPEAAFLTD